MPCQFKGSDSVASLGITREETPRARGATMPLVGNRSRNGHFAWQRCADWCPMAPSAITAPVVLALAS